MAVLLVLVAQYQPAARLRVVLLLQTPLPDMRPVHCHCLSILLPSEQDRSPELQVAAGEAPHGQEHGRQHVNHLLEAEDTAAVRG